MATPEIGNYFRKVNDWLAEEGGDHAAGYPRFDSVRVVDPPYGTTYRIAAIRNDLVEWRDVPASEYRATDLRTRFLGAHDYAKGQGFAHGFPNFHQADYGHGVVYGTHLVTAGPHIWWADVPVFDLWRQDVDPTTRPMGTWFAALHDHARRLGHGGAMPNGNYAHHDGRWVIGAMFLSRDVVREREVSGIDLGLPNYTGPPPTPPPPAPVTMPRLIGLNSRSATTVLLSAGLRLGMVWNATGVLEADRLWVTYQSRDSGAQVPAGTRIDLSVGLVRPPAPIDVAMEQVVPPPYVLLPGDPVPARGSGASDRRSQPLTASSSGVLAGSGYAIAAAWEAACPLGALPPHSCCAGGDRFENNCAHFLSNALIGAGYTELLAHGQARCSAGRPVRARELRAWFASRATEVRTSVQVGSGYWLVFQLDERSYWGGHVVLLDATGWQWYGTGWYGRWDQYFYRW